MKPVVAIPPHNLAAERAILGTALFDPTALARIAGRLTPSDFFTDAHGRIFAAALRVHAAGLAVDSITVQQALDDAEELDAVGGAAQLALLMEEASIAAHLEEYVGIVRELADKRVLADFYARGVHAANNGTTTATLLDEMASVSAALAARALTPAEPTLIREGLDLALVWPTGARCALASIRDSRRGVEGDLTVTLHARPLHWGAFVLSSGSARESLRKKLATKAPGLPWGDYLEDLCWRLTLAAREGDPIVDLAAHVSAPARVVMPRMLYGGNPTEVHADGDSLKSMFALAMLASVQSGAALPGGLRPAVTGPTMYLDYETNAATHHERLELLSAGLGIDPPPIAYKRMRRPLVEEAAPLAAESARRGLVWPSACAPTTAPTASICRRSRLGSST